MKNIAVFYGGISVEHDVSVITGVLTLNTLDRNKYNPVPVFINGKGEWFTGEELFEVENYKNIKESKLKRVTFVSGSSELHIVKKNKLKPLCQVSCAINCIHGECGEDGSLAGLLKMCNVPFASPDMFSSSFSMNKAITKKVLKGIGVKTLPYVEVSGITDYDKVRRKLGYPVLCKPTFLGSSVGITEAKNVGELNYAINNATRYGESAVIEPLLKDFTEINCAAYSVEKGKVIVSECERPIGKKEVLTFYDKYRDGRREFPAKIPIEQSEKIKKITEKIYRELNFTGIIRIDYFIKDGEIILNEINSVPGSLSYYLFCDTLKEFSGILDKLIASAEKNFAKSKTYKRDFVSSILNVKGIKSSKRL